MSATQFTNTEAAAFIPQLWDTEVLQARYMAMVIGKRVLNKSAEVKGKGSSIHIPVLQKFVGGTVSASGGFTTETNTPTDINVAINTWKYVATEIKDDTAEQSYVNLETAFLKGFGEQLALFSDIDLAGLWSGLTTAPINDNTTPPPFDDPAARAALFTLVNLNIPMDNVSFILHPIAVFNGVYALDRFVTSDKTGLEQGIQLTGQIKPIYGTPTFYTTAVANPAGTNAYKCMLLHKETFALGMQINNRFERARRTAAGVLSTVIVCNNLYGTLTVRSDHGVVINVKSTIT